MLFFRDDASFPRENYSAITNAVAFVCTVLDLSLSCVNIIFYKFIYNAWRQLWKEKQWWK